MSHSNAPSLLTLEVIVQGELARLTARAVFQDDDVAPAHTHTCGFPLEMLVRRQQREEDGVVQGLRKLEARHELVPGVPVHLEELSVAPLARRHPGGIMMGRHRDGKQWDP